MPFTSPPAARNAVRAGVALLAAAAALAALWLARDVLVLGFLAVLLAVVFSFPVGWLDRFVPRGVAVIMVLLLLAGALTGLGAASAPTLAREAQQLAEGAPRAIRDLRRRLDQLHRSAVGADEGQRPQAAPAAPVPEAVATATVRAVPAALGLVFGMTEAILVVVLAAFLVHDPGIYRRGIRRLVPREREEVFDEAWLRVRDALRHWVGGVMVAMLIMGVLTALGLLAAGIEGWLLLGVITFLGTFVPYLGAIASAIPGLLVALAQSPRHFVLALAVYFGVHLVEGYVVEPLIMRRAVKLKPALLLFGQGVMGAVLGVVGVIVATPLLVCGQVLLGYLWVERRLGKRAAAEA